MANVTALTANQIKLLMTAVSSQPEGNAIASAINNGTSASAALDLIGWQIGHAVVATSTSTTTNFAPLLVGDFVISVPAPAGTPANTTGAYFGTVATAGTLPFAAVIGDLYVAIRPLVYAQPTPTTVVL